MDYDADDQEMLLFMLNHSLYLTHDCSHGNFLAVLGILRNKH